MSPRKLAPVLTWVGGLLAAYGGAIAWQGLAIERWVYSLLAIDGPYAEVSAYERLFDSVVRVVTSGYAVALTVATLVLPSAFFVRVLARARTRSGYGDPFAGLRSLTAKRPLLVDAGLAIGPGLWILGLWGRVGDRLLADEVSTTFWLGFVAPAFLLGAVQLAISRAGWRVFTSPTVKEDELSAAAQAADGLAFRAVAVTRETRAAVGGLAVLSLGMLGASYWLPVGVLARSPAFLTALLAYLALAIGGAVLFVRSSRIAVGLDGIYISGSARARFVPYSEVDGVALDASNLDLMRGARRVLRLQLHGEDALRRHALADRIRDAIVRAMQQRDEPAALFVAHANPDQIERAASGAANYREVAPTREKLWEMLESPALDARGRAAAATALARSSDPSERVRLRRTAEQCAEPSVRARIVELLEDDELDTRRTNAVE